MIFFTYLVIALLVVLAWSRLFLRRDRFEPEPRSLLIKLFLAGAIPAALLAVVVNDSLALILPDGLVIILVAPLGEELLKLGALFVLAFGSMHFSQRVDGAIYGVSCGLGFAAAENVLYALSFGPGALGLRSLLVPLGHPLFTGLSGYYLGRHRFENNAGLIVMGYAIAVLLHAAWNAPSGLFELSDSPIFMALTLLVIPLEIFVLVRFLKRMSSPEAQQVFEVGKAQTSRCGCTR